MHKIQSMAVIAALLWSMLTIAGCGGGGSSTGYSNGDGGGSGTAATSPSVTTVNNLDQPGQPLRVGDWAELVGSGFGSSQQGRYSNGYVAFSSVSNTVKATSYSSWSDTKVVCQVPLGAPIKAPQARESMNIFVVSPDSEAGSSPLQITANPTPNPTPQTTPPSPSPSPTGTGTPSPTPTPTSSPTSSPTPSPSPTTGGGGGGGGGGTSTPHITEITPSKDEINTSSPVNFTIKGSGFGASQASVNGMVSFMPSGFIPLGTAGFSAGTASYTSLALNSGIPYVAYTDGGNGNKATVMKYTGNGATGWEAVGIAGFSAGSAINTTLVFDNGIPYVTYMDGNNGNKATVMKYTTATGWETVGSAGFSAGQAFYISLALNNGIPYVAYKDLGNGGKASVMKYTGNGITGWEAIGNAGFSAGTADYTSLAFDNGIPYVAYNDGGNGNKATMMKYTAGVGWEAVGSAGFSSGQANYISLAFNNATPYVLYSDWSGGGKATLMKYTGNGATKWEAVGTAKFSAGEVQYTSLAFDNGIPCVAYKDWGYGGKATVMKYTGNGATGWEALGIAGFSGGQADYASLAFNNGIPYVAYRDGGNGGKATVSSLFRQYGTVTGWSDGEIQGTVNLSGEKYLVEVTSLGVTTSEQVFLYKGLYWNSVGNTGFSAGQVQYTSLAFNNGIPYVAYMDGGNGNKATVMKYTAGVGWEAVGSAGFSAGTADCTSLAFDNGIPYVVYMDGGNGWKATVMKYTGNGLTGWEAVGSAGFSAGLADYTSLVFDNGIPYVAYRDVGNGAKATVMKYTGNGPTGWEIVGSAGFSANIVQYTALAFNNGIPYVAYGDGGNGWKATVMKYTAGVGWEAVGSTCFSAGAAVYTSLAFDNGIPYVAYRDGGNYDKATVMKYTAGVGWEAVGSAGFSSGQADYTSLAFNNGIPYVAYVDGGNDNKATVMKYTGNGVTGWETVGSAGFSAGAAFYTSLAFDSGIPYVAYTDVGNGWKATVMTASYKQ